MSKWGTTHCPYCKKPYASDADWEQADNIEKLHGQNSKPLGEFEDRFCWGEFSEGQCTEDMDAEKCLIAALDENEILWAYARDHLSPTEYGELVSKCYMKALEVWVKTSYGTS